ncbi:hypothetical protein ACI3KS_05275 [Microbacterium sp. ZW T5_45]|uniref:hypothetical protein n=1 Tax=Microbacterium sp. ZW T5_45 TaxID=3378080 RepID=UPI003851A372
MTIDETATLLANIQLIDNRRVEEETIIAWHVLVGDLDFTMSLEAARLHFRDSTEYLKPAHVRAGVERILLAGLGSRQDEFGNDIETDGPALAAFQRISASRKELSA